MQDYKHGNKKIWYERLIFLIASRKLYCNQFQFERLNQEVFNL